MRNRLATFLFSLPALWLAGCGGDALDATVGGTLAGLGSGLTVVVQDNGADSLSLSANGTFQFPTQLATNAPYSVTVLTQPTGQTCTIANASGIVNSTDNVSNVAVTCVANASLTGTVTGLAAGTSVTLASGSVLLPVAANGAFAFPGVIAAGTPYSVVVAVEPAGERCTVTNGQGTVPASGIASAIVVACS